MIAGGVYMPAPDILAQVRQHVAGHPWGLDAVLSDPAFAVTYGTLEGQRLKRPPQGYDETTPGIEFIKLKSFTAGTTPAGWLAQPDHLANEIVAAFRAVFPLIRWLCEALSGGGVPGDGAPPESGRLAEAPP